VAKTALIIGGTGQIGWAAAEALTRAGWDVTAAHRGANGPPPDLQARVVTVDRDDTAALADAARGHDLVVDTVAFTPDHGRQLLQLDVGSLVVISTAAVYRGSNGSYLDIATDESSFPDYPVPIDEDWPTVDNEEATYSPLKAALERVLLAGELPVSILRAGAIHGPHSPGLREWYYIKRALDGRRRCVLAWDGAGRFHHSSTFNLAALVVACADSPGSRVLNAVDDEARTDAQIAQTIFEVMEHQAEIVTFSGPPRDNVGASPWAVAKPFVLSMAKASREVGYQPVVSYREAVQRDIEWALSTLRDPRHAGQSWQEIFPGMLAFGAAGWFDYPAEDQFAG